MKLNDLLDDLRKKCTRIKKSEESMESTGKIDIYQFGKYIKSISFDKKSKIIIITEEQLIEMYEILTQNLRKPKVLILSKQLKEDNDDK